MSGNGPKKPPVTKKIAAVKVASTKPAKPKGVKVTKNA